MIFFKIKSLNLSNFFIKVTGFKFNIIGEKSIKIEWVTQF